MRKEKRSKSCLMESQRNAAKRQVKVTGQANYPCSVILGGHQDSACSGQRKNVTALRQDPGHLCVSF